MTIKQGALVKAWDDNYPRQYTTGRYIRSEKGCHLVKSHDYSYFQNAIEIPEELAKALEELGNE